MPWYLVPAHTTPEEPGSATTAGAAVAESPVMLFVHEVPFTERKNPPPSEAPA